MAKSIKSPVWSGIELEALRQEMDAPADKAVLSVVESRSLDHLRALLTEMAKNDSKLSDQLPEPMYNLVKTELAYQFTEKDIDYFRQTHEIWKEKGSKFIFILFFRALPYTYMAEKPANVLKMTKLLIDHPERRIFETAQFVFDVMDENWWEPDKRGILSALKVRIMHAAMRHIILINKNEGEVWNDAWGKPISQEDLVATNQVFSLEFFKGMEMLGDMLTPEQQTAWFHTWGTIGKIMGVQDKLIGKNVAEAWSLQHAVYAHLFKDPTIAGIPLTKALVTTLHHFHLPLKLILIMMRRMLQDEQFPDCFNRMLGPTYKDIYPEVFETYETDAEKKQHEALLRDHFHTHIRAYYHTIQDKKSSIKKNRPMQGFIEILKAWILDLIGRFLKKKYLIDIHLDMLHDILHKDGTDDPVDELDEAMILELMSALGGIMIAFLSIHFREGKQSGFRIPASLQKYWSLS